MSLNGLIEIIHSGTTGAPFGGMGASRKRFQTFVMPAHGLQTLDVAVKLRQCAGAPVASVMVELFAATGGVPAGDALATGSLKRVGPTFQVIGCALMAGRLSPGSEYALVLSAEPMALASDTGQFEWATAPALGGLHHGYLDGSTWKAAFDGDCAWLQIGIRDADNALDLTHAGSSGYTFGQDNDQIKRCQTFMIGQPRPLVGVDLKLRKSAGFGHTDIRVELFDTQSHLPVGTPLATARILAGDVGRSWTEVTAPLHYANVRPEHEYAIVLTQQAPGAMTYEWAVAPIHKAFSFGKWTGSAWVDESSLGDGWLRLWHMPPGSLSVVDISSQRVRGFGFGNSTDELHRYQTWTLTTSRAVIGVDLKLRKINGTDQADVTVDLYAVVADRPTGSPLATAKVAAGLIAAEWTVVHAPLEGKALSAGTYAMVLSQVTRRPAHYEWATWSGDAKQRFGKWNGTAWVDESSLGDGWVQIWTTNADMKVNITHPSTSGYGLGNQVDEVRRYQTFTTPLFNLPDWGLELNGVALKLRRCAGQSQSDVVVDLHDVVNGKPSGYPKATAVIPSHAIGDDWTVVKVPLHYACHGFDGDLLPGRQFAIVVGQRVPQVSRYEWATARVEDHLSFGKFNGRSWVDESGLGDGWLTVSLIMRPRPRPARLRFSPTLHGFQFQNDGFVNDYAREHNYRTKALCGGMAYAALDYYNGGSAVPDQPFRPAAGTPLRKYLFDRQMDSINSNLDRWTEFELGQNIRVGEFFNWGISSRIRDLRRYLDQGIPCVVCLMGGEGWGHQVVAFDYALGRYKADLGNYVEDFKIYVYDPNRHNVIATLVADRRQQVYKFEDNGSGGWRTYFVDNKYQPKLPPTLPNPHYPKNGLVYELALEFATGDDNLAGGGDHLDLIVKHTDNTTHKYSNISLGAHWVNDSTEIARVILRQPVTRDKLLSLEVWDTFSGGLFGDNWKMQSLRVFARGGDFYQPIGTAPAKYFTGDDKLLVVSLKA